MITSISKCFDSNSSKEKCGCFGKKVPTEPQAYFVISFFCCLKVDVLTQIVTTPFKKVLHIFCVSSIKNIAAGIHPIFISYMSTPKIAWPALSAAYYKIVV
jgi:hypothetical protein